MTLILIVSGAHSWVYCILKSEEAGCLFGSHVFHFPPSSNTALVWLGLHGRIIQAVFSQ